LTTEARTGISIAMLNALRMLGEDLREKARWCYKSDEPKAVAKVLMSDGTLSMVLYRLMQGSRESHLGSLEMVFNKLNSAFGNCVIGRGTEFGPGFVLFHSNGVVINGKVRGGSHVHLHHEVTIGDNEEGESPVLGSHIKIGAGAKLIGAVTIGDGARIGANAVVVRDVEAHTTVVGIPAKPVQRRAREGDELPLGGSNGKH
jgi:serine O-acetyltransferase